MCASHPGAQLCVTSPMGAWPLSVCTNDKVQRPPRDMGLQICVMDKARSLVVSAVIGVLGVFCATTSALSIANAAPRTQQDKYLGFIC